MKNNFRWSSVWAERHFEPGSEGVGKEGVVVVLVRVERVVDRVGGRRMSALRAWREWGGC